MQRSKTVVLNFLRDPAQYGQIKRPGRRRRLSPEQERQLFSAIATTCESEAESTQALPTAGKKSADQIRRELNLPLSARRIQQLLSQWRRDMRRATDQRHGLVATGAGSEDLRASAGSAAAASVAETAPSPQEELCATESDVVSSSSPASPPAVATV
ncbi:hypothetical protein ATCC90586_011673 [Pythium insidiosum]|nr:hypothetical protein ATCC90586_011673 [Pythium insidiosum]